MSIWRPTSSVYLSAASDVCFRNKIKFKDFILKTVIFVLWLSIHSPLLSISMTHLFRLISRLYLLSKSIFQHVYCCPFHFHSSIAAQIFLIDATVSKLPIGCTNGPTSFAMTPAFTNGLTFDTTTGGFSGTLASAADTVVQVYTITPSNLFGTGTAFTVRITVTLPVTSCEFATTPASYFTGTVYTNAVSGCTYSPTSFAISPALSAGLTFSTSTGQVSGTPTGNSVAATTYTGKSICCCSSLWNFQKIPEHASFCLSHLSLLLVSQLFIYLFIPFSLLFFTLFSSLPNLDFSHSFSFLFCFYFLSISHTFQPGWCWNNLFVELARYRPGRILRCACPDRCDRSCLQLS